MTKELTFTEMKHFMSDYYNALLIDPNIENIKSFLSDNFKAIEKNKVYKKEAFIQGLKNQYLNNIIKKDGENYSKKINYDFLQRNANELTTGVMVEQYRKGPNLQDGEGWYNLISRITAKFEMENEKIKIIALIHLSYKIEKITS